MSNTLEELFYKYCNYESLDEIVDEDWYDWDDEKWDHGKILLFKKLQDKASEIVKNNPNMDWMDDLKTALIIHHVYYIEFMGDHVFDQTVRKAWEEKRPFHIDDEGKRIIVPNSLQNMFLESQDTHGLKKSELPAVRFGVSVWIWNEEHKNIVENSCQDLELFLERERAIFGKDVSFHVHKPGVATYRMFSQSTGSWVLYNDGHVEKEGSFTDVLNEVLSRF